MLQVRVLKVHERATRAADDEGTEDRRKQEGPLERRPVQVRRGDRCAASERPAHDRQLRGLVTEVGDDPGQVCGADDSA